MEGKVKQTNCVSHHDYNLINGNLYYNGNIWEIMQVDYTYVQCVNFRCKCWDTFDQNNVKEDYDRGIIYLSNKKMWDEKKVSPHFKEHYNHMMLFFFLKPKCIR